MARPEEEPPLSCALERKVSWEPLFTHPSQAPGPPVSPGAASCLLGLEGWGSVGRGQAHRHPAARSQGTGVTCATGDIPPEDSEGAAPLQSSRTSRAGLCPLSPTLGSTRRRVLLTLGWWSVPLPPRSRAASSGAGAGPDRGGQGSTGSSSSQKDSKVCAGSGAGAGEQPGSGSPGRSPHRAQVRAARLPAAAFSRADSGSELKACVGAARLNLSPPVSACSSVNGTNSQAWNSVVPGLGEQWTFYTST